MQLIRHFCYSLFLLVAMALCASSMARAQGGIHGVEVRVDRAASIETIVLKAQGALQVAKQFELSNPSRIVIDFELVESGRVALPKNYRGKLIKTLRFGQFDDEVSRLVIETTEPVTLQAMRTVENGALGITLVAKKKAITHPAKTKTEPAPSPKTQLPLVVLDAGHGGKDPGASGIRGVREKDITLAMAGILREALLKTGRYRVALTRDDDRYILLPERVEIARKLKADIFISIHADSNPNQEARGLSVYSVSETASDKEAEALAERENKSDIIGGLDLNTADKEVASILIDLTQHETATKSLELADALVKNMHRQVNLLPGNPHRFAGFRVLKAPDVPSVLVELGFLTNAVDEKLLQTSAYRKRVADSVVKGLDRYYEKKQKRK